MPTTSGEPSSPPGATSRQHTEQKDNFNVKQLRKCVAVDTKIQRF
jgi:hypothetical protein